MKKTTLKKFCTVILGVLAAGLLCTAALAQPLVPGGQAIGIGMSTKGVMITGFAPVSTEQGEKCPAEEAGLKTGDIIVRLGKTDIGCADDFIAAAQQLGSDELSVTVERGGKLRQLNITPAKHCDGSYKLGIWLRDGISGVGTLTFFDPATGVYGALGHGISDGESGAILPLDEGSIYSTEIVDIVPGKVGQPGELSGCTDRFTALGDIRVNCACGIYGKGDFDAENCVETGQIRVGPAVILSTVSGCQTREYSVEIKRVFENDGMVTVALTVTDDALLSASGGIVQGMSGSPILQEGKLVGAVTHVFVNDPTSGYGISIQDMLSAASQCVDNAA